MKDKKASAHDRLRDGGDESEGARRATGDSAPPSINSKPRDTGQRWTVARKRQVVLRILRGESVAALSRELGVEQYKLEQWRDKALTGIDVSLKERVNDPLAIELDNALKQVGELTMKNELLQIRCGLNRPFGSRRSRK